jgi:hypothetical protein
VRVLRIALLAGLLAGASLGAAAGGVAASSSSNGVLAQVEVSANCDNPTYSLCDPTTGFGLGGIWLWVEIDSSSTPGTGNAVVSGAECGHVLGGPRGGAGSIHGNFTWWSSTDPNGFPLAFDPNNQYYNLALGNHTFAFPQTMGHYSFSPVHGVTIQVTVAP